MTYITAFKHQRRKMHQKMYTNLQINKKMKYHMTYGYTISARMFNKHCIWCDVRCEKKRTVHQKIVRNEN